MIINRVGENGCGLLLQAPPSLTCTHHLATGDPMYICPHVHTCVIAVRSLGVARPHACAYIHTYVRERMQECAWASHAHTNLDFLNVEPSLEPSLGSIMGSLGATVGSELDRSHLWSHLWSLGATLGLGPFLEPSLRSL